MKILKCNDSARGMKSLLSRWVLWFTLWGGWNFDKQLWWLFGTTCVHHLTLVMEDACLLSSLTQLFAPPLRVQISGAAIHLATFPFYFPHQQRIKCEVIGAIYIRVCGGDKTGTARPPLLSLCAVYAAALLRKNINFAPLFFCRYTPHGKLCKATLFIPRDLFFVSGDKTAG